MVTISTKERDTLPDSAFALPEERKYLILDKAHARAALARVSEGLEKGWVTKKEHDQVVKKAKDILGKD